jgi:hypothetical protein
MKMPVSRSGAEIGTDRSDRIRVIARRSVSRLGRRAATNTPLRWNAGQASLRVELPAMPGMLRNSGLSCRGTKSSNPSPSSGESVSRGISPSHVEKPGFSRGRAGWGRRRGRQRRAWRGDMAPTGGNISVGPYSSTAVLPMWFATVPALARKRGPVASGRNDIGEL